MKEEEARIAVKKVKRIADLENIEIERNKLNQEKNDLYKEKQELLELSRSSQLRHDMQVLRMKQEEAMNDIDVYIQFLNETNEMINHKPKNFEAMKGQIFLL